MEVYLDELLVSAIGDFRVVVRHGEAARTHIKHAWRLTKERYHQMHGWETIVKHAHMPWELMIHKCHVDYYIDGEPEPQRGEECDARLYLHPVTHEWMMGINKRTQPRFRIEVFSAGWRQATASV